MFRLAVFHPSKLTYYLRQIYFLFKWRHKIKAHRLRISISSNTEFEVDAKSRIEFRGIAHISSGSKLSAINGAQLIIGDNFFINRNSTIVARYGISIGDNCMLAEGVLIYDHDHVFENPLMPFNIQGYKGKEIIIGDNVWIGSHSFIGKGVTIGSNVIIGAGCIVTKDIPSNSKVMGRQAITISSL